jgi:hypothetical protein
MGAQLIHYNSPSRADTSSTAQLNLVVEMVTSSVEAAKSRLAVDAIKHTNQSGNCLNMAGSFDGPVCQLAGIANGDISSTS